MAPKYQDVQVREEYTEGELDLAALTAVCNRFMAMDRSSFDMYDIDYGSCCKITFYGYRKETDKERLTRLAVAKKQREARRAEQTKVQEAEIKMLRKLAERYPDEIADVLETISEH